MVLGDVTTSMSIWPRETFGPVIALTPFDTMEEAIRLANDSEYSLIASLWTSNLHEAMKFAPQIKAGSVQVNGATIHVEPTFGNAGLGGASGYNRFNVDSVGPLDPGRDRKVISDGLVGFAVYRPKSHCISRPQWKVSGICSVDVSRCQSILQ